MNGTLATFNRQVLPGAAALLLAAAFLAPTVIADPFFSRSEHERNGTVIVKVKAIPGAVGWQSYVRYSVTAGKNLIYMYYCTQDATIPVNGSFSPNSAAQKGMSLVANYRPQSETTAWTWQFDWPNGAPSGSVIVFNVYCTD